MTVKEFQLDIDAAAQDVLPQESMRLRLSDGFLQILLFLMVLMVHVDEGRFRLHREGSDQATFDQLMGQRFQ